MGLASTWIEQKDSKGILKIVYKLLKDSRGRRKSGRKVLGNNEEVVCEGSKIFLNMLFIDATQHDNLYTRFINIHIIKSFIIRIYLVQLFSPIFQVSMFSPCTSVLRVVLRCRLS